MDTVIKNVYKYGKYYNPAWTHYRRDDANVSCDRCHRTQLKVSIGWDKYDLCMDCVDKLSMLYIQDVNPDPMTSTATFMMQEMYDYDSQLSKMSQGMYKESQGSKLWPFSTKPKPVTRMRQGMFKDKSKSYVCTTDMEQGMFD